MEGLSYEQHNDLQQAFAAALQSTRKEIFDAVNAIRSDNPFLNESFLSVKLRKGGGAGRKEDPEGEKDPESSTKDQVFNDLMADPSISSNKLYCLLPIVTGIKMNDIVKTAGDGGEVKMTLSGATTVASIPFTVELVIDGVKKVIASAKCVKLPESIAIETAVLLESLSSTLALPAFFQSLAAYSELYETRERLFLSLASKYPQVVYSHCPSSQIILITSTTDPPPLLVTFKMYADFINGSVVETKWDITCDPSPEFIASQTSPDLLASLSSHFNTMIELQGIAAALDALVQLVSM